MRRILLTLLLCAACTPLPAPVPPDRAAVRFDVAWKQARPWDELESLLRHSYAQPDGDARELLLAAMLWPEKRDMHPDLTPHPAWAEELAPGRAHEVAEGVAGWRQRAIAGRSWSLELPLESAGQGRLEFRMPLKPGRHLWMPMPIGSDPWLDRAPDPSRIALSTDQPATWARVLLTVDAQPQPTQVYRHGDEITVAAWGVALRLDAVQLRDAQGRPLAHWFAAPE